MIGPVGKTDRRQGIEGFGPNVMGRLSGEEKRNFHVFCGGQDWEEVEGLKDEAQAFASKPCSAIVVQIKQ
tara:strand:+ start:398 stop:607 length:210 start_codon:yes stop_codon:yes gene_type:complete